MPGSAAEMKRSATGLVLRERAREAAGRRRGRAPSHPARCLDLAKNGARRSGAATVRVKRGVEMFGIDNPCP
jgi:hypothetical protein